MISTSNTSLYGLQPSSVVFACETATLGPDLQVCMCPSPNVWYWALIIACLEQVYVGSSHHLWFCACKTATLGQVSVGPKTSPVTFCMQYSVPNIRITSLYGCQPSSEVFACKPATFGPKLHVSMGPRNHLWLSAWKTDCLASELIVSMGPSPHLRFMLVKQRLLDQTYKSLRVPDLTCRFVQGIQHA